MLKEKGLSSCALILAAGLSTRMRPLTDKIPKPLVRLNDQPLIDHVIGRLLQTDIESLAVNLHYHAEQLEAYLKRRQTPHILFSDERQKLLNSGFGAKRMLEHVDGKPFLLANSDTVWIEGATKNVPRMVEIWDGARMDGLLLLASIATSLGYEGLGDFHCAQDGRLTRRKEHAIVPFAYAGFAILNPLLFENTPNEPFSLNLVFDRAIERHRLYGLRLDGIWMHIGTPQALSDAESALAGSAV
jgi:MurNAc alpha-1-phosphate uridylyltransferase